MAITKTAFIIHGSYGNPEENWFPWLKNELEKIGYKVFVPQFPIPTNENQNPAYTGHNLSEWIKTLDQYQEYINQDTIFIAHSRGCVFTYHYLSTLPFPIRATFLIAPWINYRWYTTEFATTDSFHQLPFTWEKIKSGSRHIEIFQSTNDDTPVSEGQELARLLDAKFTLVENAGHFNTRAGFTKFPLLLEKIVLSETTLSP